VPARALIRISPRGRRLAALLGSPEGLRLRRVGSSGEDGFRPERGDSAGWVEAWMRYGTVDTAVLDLLALGAEVEVLQPEELRREMLRVARRIAELHASPV
jgi:predicted DNA-binding transcriptional regulator YafY